MFILVFQRAPFNTTTKVIIFSRPEETLGQEDETLCCAEPRE